MFEKLKKTLLERIETDAVKLENLEYKPKKNADTITEKVVYLKRSKAILTGDWQRIYPPVNENGSWNIINLIFGGKKNLIRLMCIGALIILVLFGFNEAFNYVEVLKATCTPQILIG